MNTAEQFDAVLDKCHGLFEKKLRNHGVSSLAFLTDQIFIKAQRLRSIEEKGTQEVDDPLKGEFIGILNYSIMALIQLERGAAEQPDMSWEEASAAYLAKANEAKELMLRKNHDYGEAWRDMRVSSFTDLIIQKLLRVKQIEEDNQQDLDQ